MHKPNKTDRHAELCQELYDTLIVALRYTAERCGYAIGVHGSLRRDIDLIACPWRDNPIDAASLIDHLKKAVESIIGHAEVVGPEKKPNGRLAWIIRMSPVEAPYLDISVMPMVKPEPEKKE